MLWLLKLDQILSSIFKINVEFQLLTVLLREDSKSVQYGCNTAHRKYSFSLCRLRSLNPKYFKEILYSTLHVLTKTRNKIIEPMRRNTPLSQYKLPNSYWLWVHLDDSSIYLLTYGLWVPN